MSAIAHNWSYSLLVHFSVGCSLKYRSQTSDIHMSKYYMEIYYMVSPMSGEDEPSHELWVATLAHKMMPSCPLETTRRVPQEKFSRKPISFID